MICGGPTPDANPAGAAGTARAAAAPERRPPPPTVSSSGGAPPTTRCRPLPPGASEDRTCTPTRFLPGLPTIPQCVATSRRIPVSQYPLGSSTCSRQEHRPCPASHMLLSGGSSCSYQRAKSVRLRRGGLPASPARRSARARAADACARRPKALSRRRGGGRKGGDWAARSTRRAARVDPGGGCGGCRRPFDVPERDQATDIAR